MHNGLEFLRTLDINEVQSKTHISMSSLEAILSKSYDKLERIHFSGFISILEREYQIDLSDLRTEYAELNPQDFLAQPTQVNPIVNERSEKKSQKGWLVLSVLVIGAVLAFLFMDDYMLKGQKFPIGNEINNSQIEEVKEKIQNTATIKPYLVEQDTPPVSKEPVAIEIVPVVQESNGIEIIQTQPILENETLAETTSGSYNDQVTIIPRAKVWIGMIELPSMKKTNIVSAKELTIDDTKDWLIAFGHGEIDIQKDSELLKFKGGKPIYFIYEYGTLREIDKAEFKEHNQGKLW